MKKRDKRRDLMGCRRRFCGSVEGTGKVVEFRA